MNNNQGDSQVHLSGLSATLTTEDIARMLNTTSVTVQRWLQKGEIKGYKVGTGRGHWRVNVEDFEEYMRERKNVQDEP